MMAKAKILIITDRNLATAPRVIREINALKNDFEVVVYGSGKLADAQIETYNYYEKLGRSFLDKVLRRLILATKGKSTIYLLPILYLKLKKILQKHNPVIVVIHEPDWLPYLKKLKSELTFKIVFNAHEYYPLEHEGNPQWLNTTGVYYQKLYKHYLYLVDIMINVCDTIADECRNIFGKESIVIPNAAFYSPEIKATPVDKLPMRIIHHGVTNRDRKLELMIDAVALLPEKFTLDLMLVKNNDPIYYDELEQLSKRTSNVRLIDPVPFERIIPHISQYDVGLYFIYPTSFNNAAALPNKFFEYIQARLCLVVSPSKEMKKIVEKYDLGIVGEGFTKEDIIKSLASLSLENVSRYKSNSDKEAYNLSVESFDKLFLSKMFSIL